MLFLFLDATLIFRNAILNLQNAILIFHNKKWAGGSTFTYPEALPTQYNGKMIGRESQVLTNSKCIFFGTFFGAGELGIPFF